jgi:hypothetical protein
VSDVLILYRPVGAKELELIRQTDFTSFPPRLPEQPIFYPVLNEEYANQIAREWNAKLSEEKVGFVTRFAVKTEFISDYERRIVGGSVHEELWIPAEHLAELNQNIVGKIEVIGEFNCDE